MKRRFKKITAIVLVVAMTCSITGCEKGKITDTAKNSHEKNDTHLQESSEDANKALEAKKEQEEFDIYLQESFEEAACVDTITFHSMLANPENYGITMQEVTLGEFDYSEEGFAEDKKELEDDIKEVLGFDHTDNSLDSFSNGWKMENEGDVCELSEDEQKKCDAAIEAFIRDDLKLGNIVETYDQICSLRYGENNERASYTAFCKTENGDVVEVMIDCQNKTVISFSINPVY